MAPTDSFEWVLGGKPRKLDLGGITRHMHPVSHASIPAVRVPEPPPLPIEPAGWWAGCWFNPWRRKDIYSVPGLRKYNLIG